MNFKQNFFSLEGRLNREKYFLLGLLLSILVAIIITPIIMFFPDKLIIITIIMSLILVYPSLALTIKRFHDINISGTRFIPVFIISTLISIISYMYPTILIIEYINTTLSIVTGIIGLVLLFKKGTTGENKYGEDPIKAIDITNNAIDIAKSKKKRKIGRILALSIPGLSILWILISTIFRTISLTTNGSQPTDNIMLITTIKSFLNRFLGLLTLLSIPGTIVGIVLLSKNPKQNIN